MGIRALEELTPRAIQKLLDTPSDVWAFCKKENVSMSDLYSRAREILDYTNVKPKNHVRVKKSLEDPEVIVLNHLERARTANKDFVDFDEFLELTRLDLENKGIDISLNCSVESYIVNALYLRKFGNGKRKGFKRKVNVSSIEEELQEDLGVNFGKEAYKRIAGHLTPEQVQENYIIEGGVIMYKDRRGELHASPNIEGTRCWDRAGKAQIRSDLGEFVRQHLLVDNEKDNNQIFGSKGRLHSEKIRLEKERAELEKKRVKLKKVQQSARKNPVSDFHGDNKALFEFKKRFVSQYPSDQMKGIEIQYSGEMARVRFDTEKRQGLFMHRWHRFNKSLPSDRRISRLDKDSTASQIQEIDKRMEEIYEKGSEIDELDGRLAGLVKESRELNYLGLEGPNFGSYLALLDVVQGFKKGYRLNGTFVDYGQRMSNLMNSITRNIRDVNGRESGIFDGSEIVNRDIDEWMILQFVRDPEVKIIREAGEMRVTYKGKRISHDNFLEIYHGMHDTEGESESLEQRVKETSKVFDISEDFVRAIGKKYTRNFDIAFLDYVGGLTDLRQNALLNFVNSNLNDRSVVAVTFNVDPRISPKKLTGSYKKLPIKIFGDLVEIFNEGDYEIVDAIETKYREERKDDMVFQAFYLER